MTTREEWLQNAVKAITPWFEDLENAKVPEVRVSVGWPSRGGLGTKTKVVGQCWSTGSAKDKVNQIFISPVYGDSNSVDVLCTLVHEMIHAIDDCQSGHKGNFVRIARGIGLVPKWTQSRPGEELEERLKGLVERMGPIPHVALTGERDSGPKKQSTRMLKVMCGSCEYTIRTTQKWLDVGLPTCPCGTKMEEA